MSRRHLAAQSGGERRIEARRRLKAVLGPLRQRPEVDGLDGRRDARDEGRGPRRRFLYVLQRHRHLAVAFERKAAGERLEEDHTGRVQVGPLVRGSALSLLRRQVVAGADHRPRASQVLSTDPRDAEVGHLHTARPVEKDVLGRHVAVHDAVTVGGVERREHRSDEGDRGGHGQRSVTMDPLLQRLALDVLHDEIPVIAGLALVEHGHDRRVRQHRRRPAPPPESGGRAGRRRRRSGAAAP